MSTCFSPGTRWQDKLKLKNEQEVLDWRAWWLRRTRQNRRVRQGLIEVCRDDLLFYTNLFLWQRNPKELGKEVAPFWTWPFQDRAFPIILKAIEDQVSLVCEKSREMGLTWMFLIVADWLCRFHPNKQVLMMSRNEKMVESDNPDSLFWKIQFMHDHLPEWLRGEVAHRRLFYGYPNGSSISGEATTGAAGVGGRATCAFIDEFAHFEKDWEVLHRTSDTTGCRLVNSTHLGLDTAFYHLCYDRESFPETSWRKLVVHWTEHPRKSPGLYRFNQETNQIDVLDKSYHFPADYRFIRTPEPVGGPRPGIRSPWYDRACGDKGSARAVAMDLDINPQGSIAQVFDPVKIALLKAKNCCPPYWQGDVLLGPDRKPAEPLRLEQGDKGPLRLWTHLVQGRPKASKYVAGVDLSTGRGRTNSCVTIIDSLLNEKVASYTTPAIKPDGMAEITVALCRLFADSDGEGAKLVWECPGPGMDFGDVVIKLGYRNIYYRTQSERTGPRLISRDKAEVPGWFQTNDGMRWLIDRYCRALEGQIYITREELELNETLSFQWTPDGRTVKSSEETAADDPSGAKSNHGDRVVASALAWMLCSEWQRKAEVAEARAVPVGSLAWRRQMAEDESPETRYEEEDNP